MTFPFYCVYPLILLKNGDKIPPDHRGYDKLPDVAIGCKFEHSPVPNCLSVCSKDRYVTHQGRIEGARDVLQSCDDSVGLIAPIIQCSNVVSDFFIGLANYQIAKHQTISISQFHGYNQMMQAAKNLPVITSLPKIVPLCQSHFQSFTEYVKSSKSKTAISDFIHTQLGIATIKKYEEDIRTTDTGITGMTPASSNTV